jgi:hypothetical protein
MTKPGPKPSRKFVSLSATYEPAGTIDPLSATPEDRPTKSYATRSPGQILAQQKLDAERDRAAKAAAKKKPESNGGTAVAAAQPTAVTPPDGRSTVTRYLDEVAPSSIVGRMIKFDRDGNFVTPDDEGEIKEDTDFVVLADQTLVGWIKFNPDEPPSRAMGALYDGFAMPPRESLGDTNQAEWPDGLDGQPEDPWRHQIYLVLQQAGTTELFTFVTSSRTGRRAAGNLLRHFDRMAKTHPDQYPVVRLKKGGFNHKDERIGWVHTPVFAVVGRAPRDSAAKPDTSPSGDMNDSIGF